MTPSVPGKGRDGALKTDASAAGDITTVSKKTNAKNPHILFFNKLTPLLTKVTW